LLQRTGFASLPLHGGKAPRWLVVRMTQLAREIDSSGVTTVVTGVLKQAINPEELGLAVCGGKGKFSLQAPTEIEVVGETFGLSTHSIRKLRHASRMAAKVDNTAIQAGYPLYHHAFLFTEDGKWAVIQQGMNVKDRTARRYHWLS